MISYNTYYTAVLYVIIGLITDIYTSLAVLKLASYIEVEI
jgi:hypothetical protein